MHWRTYAALGGWGVGGGGGGGGGVGGGVGGWGVGGGGGGGGRKLNNLYPHQCIETAYN